MVKKLAKFTVGLLLVILIGFVVIPVVAGATYQFFYHYVFWSLGPSEDRIPAGEMK